MAGVLLRGSDGAVARALAARLGANVTSSEADAAVVVDLGPPGATRREQWERDVAAGRHVLATSMDPDDARWAAQLHDRVVGAGVLLLPNAGAAAVLADLLAAIAAGAAGAVRAIHTAHFVAERGGLLGVAGRGLRTEVASLLSQPIVVVEDGRARDEPVAQRRRLAWFARPVGPHHAASVWCPEVVTIARHLPEATTVVGHLAVGTWRSELLQGVGQLARLPRVGAAIEGRLRRSHAARPDARWAVVVEVEGQAGVARAWANGRDLAALVAGVLDLLVQRLLEGGSAAGALAPAQLVDPGDFLDQLGDAVDLRWSLVRPDADNAVESNPALAD